MKILRNLKKAAVMGMAVLTLTCSFAVPAMAHCHGGGHCGSSQKGVYCPYHETYHSKKSSCNHYCPKHKTTHESGKQHHSSHHNY